MGHPESRGKGWSGAAGLVSASLLGTPVSLGQSVQNRFLLRLLTLRSGPARGNLTSGLGRGGRGLCPPLGQLHLVLTLSLVPHGVVVDAADLLVDHLVLALVLVPGLLHVLAHRLVDKVANISVEGLDNILAVVDKIIRTDFLVLRLNNVFTLRLSGGGAFLTKQNMYLIYSIFLVLWVGG